MAVDDFDNSQLMNLFENLHKVQQSHRALGNIQKGSSTEMAAIGEEKNCKFWVYGGVFTYLLII